MESALKLFFGSFVFVLESTFPRPRFIHQLKGPLSHHMQTFPHLNKKTFGALSWRRPALMGLF